MSLQKIKSQIVHLPLSYKVEVLERALSEAFFNLPEPARQSVMQEFEQRLSEVEIEISERRIVA